MIAGDVAGEVVPSEEEKALPFPTLLHATPYDSNAYYNCVRNPDHFVVGAVPTDDWCGRTRKNDKGDPLQDESGDQVSRSIDG